MRRAWLPISIAGRASPRLPPFCCLTRSIAIPRGAPRSPNANPFAEIRDNLISADLLPIDLLRCKLSFFGANRFDPRSDRWVRICMYQDAPFPHEILQAPR